MSIAPDMSAPERLDELERYWTGVLLPFTPSSGVTPDYRRPVTPSDERATLTVPLTASLADRAMQTAEGKTPRLFALVVTACALLLHRQEATAHVSVLTPVSETGADDVGTNRWLAVKVGVEPDVTLADLHEGVRASLAGAFAHQAFPFARVLDVLDRAWPAARAPLSDVAVAFAGVSRLDVLSDLASDLIVIGAVEQGTLAIHLRYRADLFAADSIAAFGHRVARLLAFVLEQPGLRVQDVRLLSAEEDAAAVARLAAWDRHALPDQRVEDLIAATAQAAPGRAAFVHGGTTLTYGDLMRQAGALAQALRAAGVQPGDRVAVALDHGLRAPVALLGTLCAGAAFVPLDPRHPISRLQAIVSQVAPAVILAEPRLHAAFEGSARLLDWPEAGAAGDDDGLAGDRGGPDAIAYVMFTSGSTGEPNGVEISHRSLVNYLLWAKAYYLGADTPTFALYSSIAFDLTLTSIFLPLIAGSTAIVFSFDEGVVDMPAVFADPRVELVKGTPSHMKLLRPAQLRGSQVRRLILGGEAFEWEQAAALQEALPAGALIFNEYGPTEATIACAAHRFDAADRPAGTVPIGEAIWNAGVYVLDEQRRPTPSGLAGELWISGVPVAVGYAGRPERTSASFVDDPIVPGWRMYATGDRARRDAAGRLYYLGRRDDQVKFNGVRVELSEVRAALRLVPRVRDSIVRIVEDERRVQVMVAYYVARQAIDVSILRAGLLARLPPEMIPTLFVRLAKLPLSLNGKVDVDRLPSLEEVRNTAPQAFTAPRSSTEQTVAAVWRDVLRVDEISVHSNFFELGGHSLLASQVAWQTTERLGIEMPLRWLFDHPTIAQIAQVLDEQGAGHAAAVTGADMVRKDDVHHG